jgi:elongation factor G
VKVYDAVSIRNVALVGHSGAGKTQLASAMLFDAGAVNRLGRVDEGTTVTDYDDEEIARKHTLSCSLAYAEWNKHKINIIDTPGMANFLSDARAALRVADAALVVVDAVSGAEVTTEKVWTAADEFDVPRIVVLNRLDRERASLDRSLESLRSVFGRTVIPIQLPIGVEKQFKGVVDLVSQKAWTFTGENGKPSESAIPADMESAAQAARDALIEMVAEADDALMEKFFDAGTLTQEELVGGLKRGIAAGRIFPLLCVSGAANVGVQPLLDAIVNFVPSPAERGIKLTDDSRLTATDNAPAAASCGKR